MIQNAVDAIRAVAGARPSVGLILGSGLGGLADVLEGKLGALGKRMGHLLFKLSVDQNLMGNILAADIEIDPDQLRKARVRCVKEVKETNSEISFEDTVRYQKGAE